MYYAVEYYHKKTGYFRSLFASIDLSDVEKELKNYKSMWPKNSYRIVKTEIVKQINYRKEK